MVSNILLWRRVECNRYNKNIIVINSKVKAVAMKNNARLEGNIYRNEQNKGVKDGVKVSRTMTGECGALTAVRMVGWMIQRWKRDDDDDDAVCFCFFKIFFFKIFKLE